MCANTVKVELPPQRTVVNIDSSVKSHFSISAKRVATVALGSIASTILLSTIATPLSYLLASGIMTVTLICAATFKNVKAEDPTPTTSNSKANEDQVELVPLEDSLEANILPHCPADEPANNMESPKDSLEVFRDFADKNLKGANQRLLEEWDRFTVFVNGIASPPLEETPSLHPNEILFNQIAEHLC